MRINPVVFSRSAAACIADVSTLPCSPARLQPQAWESGRCWAAADPRPLQRARRTSAARRAVSTPERAVLQALPSSLPSSHLFITHPGAGGAAAADMRRGRPRAAAVGARAGLGGRVPCTGLGRGVAAPGRRATGVAARPHPAAAHGRACRGARCGCRAAAHGAGRCDGCRVMRVLARRCGNWRGGQHLRHRLFLAARIMVPRIGTVLELAARAARLLCCPADGGGCGTHTG